jgi:hypothetical protein
MKPNRVPKGHFHIGTLVGGNTRAVTRYNQVTNFNSHYSIQEEQLAGANDLFFHQFNLIANFTR